MVRRLSALVALSILAGLIPAVSLPAIAAPAVPPPLVKSTATIRGTITDAATGNPVAGACVSLLSRLPSIEWLPVRNRVCTGADGQYTFGNVPPLTAVTVEVDAPGFPKRYWPNAVDVLAASLIRPPSEKVTIADVSLSTAAAAISGVVRKPDGTPAPYAFVGLYPVGTTTSRVSAFRTGADGQFARTNIPPGTYEVAYSWNSMQTWYGSPDGNRAGAVPVQLIPGAPVAMEATVLSATQDVRIPLTGTVTAQGQPVKDATVEVGDGVGTIYATAVTDTLGAYSVPALVADSGYYVRVSKPGYGAVWGTNSIHAVRTVVTADPLHSELVSDPGTLSGRLTDFDGTWPLNFGAKVYSANNGQYSLKAEVPLRHDGGFEVPNLPPGSYAVAFWTSTLGREQYYPGAATLPEAGILTIQSGQRMEISENLFAPAYIYASVTDAENGAPIPGACLNTRYCAAADGKVWVGPLWQAELAEVVKVWVNPGPLYYSQQQEISTTRGQVTQASYSLRPGAAVEMPVPGNYGGACLVAVPVVIGQPEDGACGGIREGKLTIGPLEPGRVHLLLQDSDIVATQWLTGTGGTGRRADARVFDLQPRTKTSVEGVDLAPGQDFSATVRSMYYSGGPCVGLTPKRGFCTGSDSNSLVTLKNLGTYAWEIRYSAIGHATVWSGNASSRSWATPEITGGAVLLLSGGGIGGITLVGEERLMAYDAYTGDMVSHVNPFWDYRGLNDGIVVWQFNNGSTSCWLYRDGSPYFKVRAGTVNEIGAIIPGVNCLPQAPNVLITVPRMPEPDGDPAPVPRLP